MDNRIAKTSDWVRKTFIASGYLGTAAIILGILITFLNHHSPVKPFETLNEISGVTLLVVGVLLLVISCYAVWKWFRE